MRIEGVFTETSSRISESYLTEELKVRRKEYKVKFSVFCDVFECNVPEIKDFTALSVRVRKETAFIPPRRTHAR
jgi:hypothetical protein